LFDTGRVEYNPERQEWELTAHALFRAPAPHRVIKFVDDKLKLLRLTVGPYEFRYSEEVLLKHYLHLKQSDPQRK